jgi:hypothetical protein
MTNVDDVREFIRSAAGDRTLDAQRFTLANVAAEVFDNLGVELSLIGHHCESTQTEASSECQASHGEIVAIALLLRVASQLTGSCAELFAQRKHYAAAALLRQLVEVEYLAWAFEKRDRDAQKWLQSTREEREKFFRPLRLRRASKGHFRDQDYRYHCEMGGHPVPGALILFGVDADSTGQLLLADALGHVGHIWNHVASWATSHGLSASIQRHGGQLPRLHRHWCANDPLIKLPPPP